MKATQLVYCDGVSMISSAALLLLGDAPLDLQVDDLGYVAPGQQPRKRNALVVGGWMVVELPSYEEVLTVQAFHRSLHDMLMVCKPALPVDSRAHDAVVAASLIHTAFIACFCSTAWRRLGMGTTRRLRTMCLRPWPSWCIAARQSVPCHHRPRRPRLLRLPGS